MDNSKNKTVLFYNRIVGLLKWIKRAVVIIISAMVIGFSNAYYDENKMINNTKSVDEQEQVIDD